MAAFYPLARCDFQRRGSTPSARFRFYFLRLCIPAEVEKIVHRVTEILFATEVAFRRLYRCVPQQELNLLQLAPARVAQLRTGPPQVMRCNVLQTRSLTAGLDHIPNDILRDALAPYLSGPGDGSKDPSISDSGCGRPLIECSFDPSWNGDGADMSALADQVHHCPVPLAHLDFIQF